MSKLTSGRLIENDSGDKLNGVSTRHHADTVYSLPWVISEDEECSFGILISLYCRYFLCIIFQSHCSLITRVIEGKKKARLSTGLPEAKYWAFKLGTFQAYNCNKRIKKWIHVSHGHNNWNLNLRFSVTAFTQKRIHRSIFHFERSKVSLIAVTSFRIAVVIATFKNEQIKSLEEKSPPVRVVLLHSQRSLCTCCVTWFNKLPFPSRLPN